MRIGRTIVAFLVALSLAMLPMAGAFAMPRDEVAASEALIASAHDCCDEMPAGHTMNDCRAAAGCATKCFNFFAIALPGTAVPPPTGGTDLPFASDPVHARTASLPFRPPRS